jgi:hypothetical protein
MRVFNITDASTAALRAQGLENQHIRVGSAVIAPGTSVDLRGTARERSELQSFLKVRAVVIDELPVDYAAKRGLDIRGRKLAPEPKEGDTFKAEAPAPEFKMEPIELLPELPEFPKKKGK